MMSGEVCPTCGQMQRAKRGEGAAYALKAKRLNKRSIQIIAWWYSDPWLRHRELTKRDIENGFRYVGRQALGARISEMLAWRIVIWANREKGSYRLDIEKATKILNACGNLNVLRDGMTA
jgi:hypothetical protein